MSRSVVDRIVAHIIAAGEAGASSEALAALFLNPVAAPPGLCDKLIANALAGDPRVRLRPDGRWAAPPRPKSPSAVTSSAAYTVMEALEVRAATRSCVVECAVCHLDETGRMGSVKGAVIRPDPWPEGLIVPPQLKEKMRDGTSLEDAVDRAVRFARNTVIVAWKIGGFHTAAARALVSEGATAPLLSLQQLSRRLLGVESATPEALAAQLKIPAREPTSAHEQAQFTAELLSALLARRQELKLATPEQWTEIQHARKVEADFSRFEFDREFLDSLPEKPGIYLMRDGSGHVIYAGKGSNLRARVRSYFRARIERDEKIERILESLSRIETVETGSDLAALLAEQRAIREFQPPINIQYEVHERPALAAAPDRRLALILPAPDEAQAEVFLLHGARALRRAIIPRDQPALLRPLLEEFFFRTTPPEADEAQKTDLAIAWSWLNRHADRVNALDVDLAGGLEPALHLLERYLREEPGKKVYHV